MVKANIDGKNVGDDFSWWCDDQYVENIIGTTHRLLFWNNDNPCILTYSSDNNEICVEIHKIPGSDYRKALENIVQRFEYCKNTSDSLVWVFAVNDNIRTAKITCQLYIKEE